jgi:hypothetical protein
VPVAFVVVASAASVVATSSFVHIVHRTYYHH